MRAGRVAGALGEGGRSHSEEENLISASLSLGTGSSSKNLDAEAVYYREEDVQEGLKNGADLQ